MSPDTNFLSGTAKTGPYRTQLPMVQEAQFQQWVKQNRVPFNDSPKSDYDMRGFWQAAQQGKASTQVNPSDNQIHYPDTWKTPYHKSFSRESKYATQNAPTWNGDDQRGFKLQDKIGNVLQDESVPKFRYKGVAER